MASLLVIVSTYEFIGRNVKYSTPLYVHCGIYYSD